MTVEDRGMPETLSAAFHEAAARFPGKAALRFRGDDGAFRSISYRALEESVAALASSLARLGIEKGDRVAIFAYHGPEWVMTDLASLQLGAVVVPLYHSLTPAAVKYILNDAGCKLAFAGSEELSGVIEAVRSEIPSLERVVVRDGKGLGGERDVVRFRDLVEGKPEPRHDAPGDGSLEEPDPGTERFTASKDDPATIVYTSGTTGRPKGVVLSHGSILFNAFSLMRRFDVGPGDVFLSFLPLCHMLERTCGYYTMLFAGATIAYAESVSTIAADVRQIRPTIIIVVPRIVEKICEAAELRVREASFLGRKLVLGAVRTLNERVNRVYRGEGVPFLLRVKSLLSDRLVASRFRKAAGGRLRLLVSGGAPLDRKLAKTLHVLGFNIVEGYGLTEAAPVVCTCTLDDLRLGTVGKPFDGVEVKIGEADEILVRGPNLMCGYFNLEDETARAIDADGWFHTGDRGRFDERGNLVITGRIKELIVTSYGKKVAPVPIEAAIARSPYIDQVLLFGDNRKFISALVVPRRELVERYARDAGIQAGDYEELLGRDGIRGLVAEEIERATTELAPFEKVKAFTLLAEGFTIENELLTPTLKLRRSKIVERYRERIEAMYASREER